MHRYNTYAIMSAWCIYYSAITHQSGLKEKQLLLICLTWDSLSHWTKQITGPSINLKQGLRCAIMLFGSSVWVPVPGWTLCLTSYQHLATALLIPGTLLQPRARAKCARRRRPLSLIDKQNGARPGPAEREELRRCRRARKCGWTGNWLMKKHRVYSLLWILIKKSLCVYNIVYVLAMQVRCWFLFYSQRLCETTL